MKVRLSVTLTVEHGLGGVHQHPQQGRGGERLVDAVVQRVAGGRRPGRDPEGGGAGGIRGWGAHLRGGGGRGIRFTTCGT